MAITMKVLFNMYSVPEKYKSKEGMITNLETEVSFLYSEEDGSCAIEYKPGDGTYEVVTKNFPELNCKIWG